MTETTLLADRIDRLALASRRRVTRTLASEALNLVDRAGDRVDD